MAGAYAKRLAKTVNADDLFVGSDMFKCLCYQVSRRAWRMFVFWFAAKTCAKAGHFGIVRRIEKRDVFGFWRF